MKKQGKKKWYLKQLVVIAVLFLGCNTIIHLQPAMAVDADSGSQESGDSGDGGSGNTDGPGETDDPGDTDDSADVDNPGDGYEAPSYTNAAQAQHAANLAAAAAAQPDENIDAAFSAVEDAEAALEEAEQLGIQEDIDIARENLAKAQEEYTDLVAEKTGVLSQEIAGMRNSGMGWGQIAHELGVHPGLLGLGHAKKGKGAYDEASMNEMAEATERNTRSGWSKGHGVGLNAGVESTAKTKGGYAFGLSKDAKGGKKGGQGGISGASGLSSSGGKGGSHGGGSGGGSGNGKGGVAGTDGSPGKSGKGNGKGGGSDKGNNKGGNSGNGKGGGKGK